MIYLPPPSPEAAALEEQMMAFSRHVNSFLEQVMHRPASQEQWSLWASEAFAWLRRLVQGVAFFNADDDALNFEVTFMLERVWPLLARLALVHEADRLEAAGVADGERPREAPRHPAGSRPPPHELPSLCEGPPPSSARAGEGVPAEASGDARRAVSVLGAFVRDLGTADGSGEGVGRYELLLHALAERSLAEYLQLRRQHWTWEGSQHAGAENWMCLTSAESHWWDASCAFSDGQGTVEVEGFLFSMSSYSLRVRCLVPSRFAFASKLEVSLALREAKTGFTARLLVPLCRRTGRPLRNVTVCTKPLFKSGELLEKDPDLIDNWIEYHRLLGVDHFQIYDTDGSFSHSFPNAVQGSVTYVGQFPALISEKFATLEKEGFHSCLISQSYDHCFFENAQTSRWVLHLHAPDSYVHTTQPEMRIPTGLPEWLGRQESDVFHGRLCAVSLRAMWIGGQNATSNSDRPVFARYQYRLPDALEAWNRSETIMRTSHTVYLGGHKPLCNHRTYTLAAPSDSWRMNHFVDMDRTRCEGCVVFDPSSGWAAGLLGAAAAEEFVRLATRPTGSSLLPPVSAAEIVRPWLAERGRTPFPGKSGRDLEEQPRRRAVPLRRVPASGRAPGPALQRFDGVLEPGAAERLHGAVRAGRFLSGSHLFEASLDELDRGRAHGGPEAEEAAGPLLEAAAQRLPGPGARGRARALGLLRHVDELLEPRRGGLRFLYFPHTFPSSNVLDGLTHVAVEFEACPPGGHAINLVPQFNVGPSTSFPLTGRSGCAGPTSICRGICWCHRRRVPGLGAGPAGRPAAVAPCGGGRGRAPAPGHRAVLR
ncbi:unnamed protein product [Prorocentrum cordatum]|uniref:Uncharacterized protein n=1 Tax=Prorocentrum cordatum TaxID=2364126 RepID=A0ABN9Q0Y3_9DINO|nr:unnamed protein product [Polarella glacialis]